MKTYAILLCSGKSKRFAVQKPCQDKLFLRFLGQPIFLRALRTLNNNKLIDKIFITANKINYAVIARESRRGGTAEAISKLEKIVLGGKTRQDSVKKAVFYIAQHYKPDFLVIHNGANPFVTNEEITKCISFLKKNKKIAGVGVGRKISKTIKKITEAGQVTETLNRKFLFEMETPQAVRFKEFLLSLRGVCLRRTTKQSQFTDDLVMLETAGFKTHVLSASEKNRKITFPSDFPFNFRMGIGEDSHYFSKKHRGLYLGGVLFKKFQKLEANSDGDVILHAIATAISQAIGGGSLNTFAKPLFEKGIKNSAVYLKKILEILKSKNFQIQNLGINIEALKPKIDPIAPRIKKNLSKLLDLPESHIGITAHTGEGLTEFGKGRGIRCSATVTLV